MKKLSKSLNIKLFGIALAAILIGVTTAAHAAPTWGSTVNVSGIGKYGFAWTKDAGQTVGARIVINGEVSDVTSTGYAQTDQVDGWSYNIAYINHSVNGVTVAWDEK
ncbi:hypothetical protein [Paenibacillus sp. L3-i20]|uniref:hypothetical protein n=1 Tax=Paenibacillus sp. L3-i20 TaxID=2905833 RepID=UPI001EDD08B7|nr:hypothetical protein [Paenibacillus sp. L3-i20]GKU77287.1 hypothetical protein L3i20_v216840 [Paenibacillus sp. L3-i20]